MRTAKSKRRISTAEKEKAALRELVTIQKKVLAGEPVPNLEYNKVLTKLRRLRRGNWRVFTVEMTVEAQSDWTTMELKEHLKLILEDSLLRRYSVKAHTVPGKGRKSL